MFRWSAVILVSAAFILPVASAAEERAAGQGAQSTVPGTPLERREVEDSLGRKITYYISQPKRAPAPILLMLQGSGCARVINEQRGSSFSTVFNLIPFAQAGQFTVVAIEKPHSMTAGQGGSAGSSRQCSAEFNEDFTAERWLVAIRAALDDAKKAAWVDARRTLVFGSSEGAVMGSLLAGQDSSVTDVVSISGSGTTQLFDFIVLAYQHCFNSAECLADVDRNLKDINSDPNSATRFAWGHAYKRWTSFFRVDPGAELLRSKARVYMAFGTADQNVPALSAEHAVARLRIAGRDVTVRRIPDAGHSLARSSDGNWTSLDKEFRAALDWFWQR